MKRSLYIVFTLILSIGAHARQEYVDLSTHQQYYYTTDQTRIQDHPWVFAGDIYINYLQLRPSHDFKNVAQVNQVLYYWEVNYSKTDALKSKLRNHVQKLYGKIVHEGFDAAMYEPNLKEVDSQLQYIYGQLLCFKVDFTVTASINESEDEADIIYTEYFYLSLSDAKIYTIQDLFPAQQWAALSKRVESQLKDTLKVICKEDLKKAALAKLAVSKNNDPENGEEEEYGEEYEETLKRMSIAETIEGLHLSKEDLVLYLFADQAYMAYEIPQNLSFFKIEGTLYMPIPLPAMRPYITSQSPLNAFIETNMFKTPLRNVNVFKESNYYVHTYTYGNSDLLDFSPYRSAPYPRLKKVAVVDSSHGVGVHSYTYNQKGFMTAFENERKLYTLTYNSQNKVSKIMIRSDGGLDSITFKYDRQQNLISYVFEGAADKKTHSFKYLGNRVYETIQGVYYQEEDFRSFSTNFDMYEVDDVGNMIYQKSNAIRRTYNAQQQMLSEANDYISFHCYGTHMKILSSEISGSYGMNHSGSYYSYDSLQRVTELLCYTDRALSKKFVIEYPEGNSNLIQAVVEKIYPQNVNIKYIRHTLQYSFW